MKSMKLASGFAISALALAIAGSATAQTTTEVDFTGSVKVNTEFDFENDTRVNGMPGYATGDASDDWFNLEATWTVSNGPFSGDLIVGLEEQDGSGVGRVEVDNLIVSEGPISFGQVGSVVNTAGLMEGMTDYTVFGAVGMDELDLSLPVDGAFRYSLADFGLQVQAEGEAPREIDDVAVNSGAFGVGAGITQDLDIATVWADFQFRELRAPAGGEMLDDTETYFGAAVQVTPVDMVTLTATVNNRASELEGDQTAAGVTADVNATDTIALSVGYVDVDLGDELAEESDFVTFGASAGFDAITVELGYQAWVEEFGQGLLESKVSYAAAPFGAFAEFNVGLGDEDTFAIGEYTELVLGADYTTNSGIVMGTKYSLVDVTHAGEAGEDEDKNELELFAQYSF